MSAKAMAIPGILMVGAGIYVYLHQSSSVGLFVLTGLALVTFAGWLIPSRREDSKR